MNLEHTGDPLYKHVAAEFDGRPGAMTDRKVAEGRGDKIINPVGG